MQEHWNELIIRDGVKGEEGVDNEVDIGLGSENLSPLDFGFGC